MHRHAWIGVLAVGTALFLAVERTLVATQNPNMVPTVILLGAAVGTRGVRRVHLRAPTAVHGRRQPARPGGVPRRRHRDRRGRNPGFDAQRDLGGLPMLGVGLIEEASKLIIPAGRSCCW